MVNVISWISLIGLAVSAMALIVVLSVYNGIGQVTQSLFNSFDPPLIVQPTQGKTLSTTSLDALRRIEGVATVSPFVEENAWLTFRDRQAIVALRGVDTAYHLVTGLDTLLYDGYYPFAETEAGALPSLLLGADIYYDLGMSPHTNITATLLIPNRQGPLGSSVADAFRSANVLPAGNFLIQQDIDQRYAVAPIATVRYLLDYDSTLCTAIAIGLEPRAKVGRVQRQVAELIGPDCKVLDRYEQQPLYYKIFRSERLGIYIILALIVFISTLSLVASLSLLIIDKQRDAQLLQSLGMTRNAVRRTFFAEGVMICLTATLVGLAVGFVLCFVQQQFGLVRMGDGNFVVRAFPVAMKATDFVASFLLVSVISSCAVALTVRHSRL